MKFLHLDSRSILPRVETLHLMSRIITILSLLAYMVFGEYPEIHRIPLLIILSAEVLISMFSWRLSMRRRAKYTRLFLFTIFIDIIIISGLIYVSGGSLSPFYLIYFLTVSLGAYIMSSTGTMFFSGLVTACYVAAIYNTIQDTDPLTLTVRVVFIWFYAIMLNYVSEYIRRSENRLLKLFNTLNRRTSELEKIHAQLEMVYENSRILAGILDYDQIAEELLKIGEKVLDYPALGIMLFGPGNTLLYRGRLISGQKNTHLKAVKRESFELAYRVAHAGEPVRVVDLAGRDDYEPILKKAGSAVLVPMETHGETTGLLVAESPREGAFEERDERFLSILARSAAMALENAALHSRVKELTTIDELTGTYNYRYFALKLEEEKRRAVRYNLALSLIMLDIDWFKRFNDSYGHEVGNRVLAYLTQVVKRCIRDVDILCRYGGEEFVILLPQTPEREALSIAQRIRYDVENAEFGGGGNMPKLRVTVSVGVSSYPENGLSEEELINAVDQAMYRAKGSGKNTVCTV